jgi:hypothetical protein
MKISKSTPIQMTAIGRGCAKNPQIFDAVGRLNTDWSPEQILLIAHSTCTIYLAKYSTVLPTEFLALELLHSLGQ